MARPDPILRTTLAGLDLASPVILAAGTAGTLDEIASVTDLSLIGALVTKSITPEPRAGNPAPRVVPLSVGMLNAIGLANPGIDRFAADYAPRAAALACPVIGSAAGFSIADYERVVGVMASLPGIAAIELNVSCPNVHGGVEFGADPAALREVVGAARAVACGTPLWIKLPPVAVGTPHSIVDLARAAIEAGAAVLTLCNTTPAMAIDIHTGRPRLGNTTGGLSGPAVHPIVVRLVHLVYRGVAREAGVPIVAAGGVMGWPSAAEFILAGASAVQVGAGSMASVRTPARVAAGLARWARGHGAAHLTELVGSIHLDG